MKKKVQESLASVNGVAVRGPLHLRSVAGGRQRHRDCGVEFGAAKQEFKDEADINRIIAKYRATGVLDQVINAPVSFGEDRGFMTYADAHAALEKAREEFLKLPPEIRLELGNDPGRYAELSTEEGVRRVVERIGAKERRRIADAQALVASLNPPSPAGGAPGGEGKVGSAPPEGGKK